jgi:AraC-like DNA-binding protein
MPEIPDIIALAHKEPVLLDELPLLMERDRQIPGTWQYAIRRYRRNPQKGMEDTGLLAYHYRPEDPSDKHLELRFCLAGNSYCGQKAVDCDLCRDAQSRTCEHKLPTVDVLSFRFEPAHLSSFAKGQKKKSATDALLNFRHTESFSVPIQLGPKVRTTLDAILNHTYSDTIENIFINAQTQILLLYSLEGIRQTMEEEEQEVPACKFLTNELDREKIVRAREILIQHIGDPITIKELSRKVAINECYLKKGFKVMFGSTIFDFYQDQRMEHAKYLLYEKGKTVSEVSALLGYSSISHFSTAFKKHTGLKPCELLVR